MYQEVFQKVFLGEYFLLDPPLQDHKCTHIQDRYSGKLIWSHSYIAFFPGSKKILHNIKKNLKSWILRLFILSTLTKKGQRSKEVS